MPVTGAAAGSRATDGSDGSTRERGDSAGESTGASSSAGGSLNAGASAGGRPTVTEPSDGASTSDGAQGGAAGQARDGAAGEPSSQVGTGVVQVTTFTDSPTDGETETDFVAEFMAPAPPPPCTMTQIGACALISCDVIGYIYGGPDAGDITIQSDDAGFSKQFNPNHYGAYEAYYDTGFTFKGGQNINVTAVGNAVPSFQDQIQFPEPLVLTAPSPSEFSPDGTIYIPPHQDLTLTWDRGAAGVSLDLLSYAQGMPYLSCAPPSEQGTLTIPASVLEQLPPSAKFDISTTTNHIIHLGHYDVTVWAVAGVLSASMTHRIKLQLD